MENKTLTSLYSKGRHRFAKVAYISCYSLALLFIIVILVQEGWSYEMTWGLLITVAIFEAIKRAFYYVVLGTIKPKK